MTMAGFGSTESAQDALLLLGLLPPALHPPPDKERDAATQHCDGGKRAEHSRDDLLVGPRVLVCKD